MGADFTVVFALYPRVTQLDFTGPEVSGDSPAQSALWPPSAAATWKPTVASRSQKCVALLTSNAVR
jgi:hypothetical protein